MKPIKKPTPRLPVAKRTSIGSGAPINKHKRRNHKAYRGQGRP
jgi:hypothetical protein